MATAVLSDIHSNFHALAACYEDARRHGAEAFIFLGDFVSDLADPVRTLELVYEISHRCPTVCVRGNREGYMLAHRDGAFPMQPGSKTGSLLYTYSQLRLEDLGFFESLPIHDVTGLGGIPFEIAHAVKGNDRYYFEANDPRIGPVFAQMEHPFFLTGHSHRQYVRSCQGKTILNPGSVGVPIGSSGKAQYALLTTQGQQVSWQLRQVRYDLEAVVCRQYESGLADQGSWWAISVLYDVITGREHASKLLQRVQQYGDGAVYDETLWDRAAAGMGLSFQKESILALIQ